MKNMALIFGAKITCAILLFASSANADVVSEVSSHAWFDMQPGLGTVGWGTWEAFSFTSVDETRGGVFDYDADFLSGNGTNVTSTLSMGNTVSSVDTYVVNPGVTVPEVSTFGSAALYTPDVASARNWQQSYVTNTFTITGGVGEVDVDFNLIYDFYFDTVADAAGSFEHGGMARLSVYLDSSSIFGLEKVQETFGSNTTLGGSFSGTESGAVRLMYGQKYGFLLRSDSYASINNAATSAVVPVPPAFAMAGLGFGILALGRRMKRRA